MSENELGAFLRARREAVTPTEVGLPSGPRRRTPGLRRSEVATLAGISVEYLTRLEQGRDRHPSAQVLGALADALRLTVEERIHLRRLEKERGADPCCPAAVAPTESVRPTVRAVLDSLEPTPAVLLNRLADVLACTTGYRRIAEPLGILDGERPNLARYVFTDERARAAYPEWDRLADDLVGHLKTESMLDDSHVRGFTDELTVDAGAPFADRIAAAPVLPRRSGLQRITHPGAGPLRLEYETFALPDADPQRLIVYVPADAATSAALDRLTGRRPGGLHVVNG
ncbi:helix-turn-helix domain-containing protein [Streptomyces atriruber]|uniref:helix-turn-helix domain-containing protein n=1 Tax=Streptomyces atriruber TaxID=545121 RepID=UPI0006E3922D|nr:helix-turn-helix transcriptional regulator [Streptomyces atriruber]